MRFRAFILLLPAMIIAAAAVSHAEEGMWQLDRFDDELFARMQALGLELSQEQLYTPDGKGVAYAIVNLGGGTGSFISPKGLILTNHHVAFGALQRASTSDNNLIENGFYSSSHETDIKAEGYEASVLLSIEDVTKQVLGAAGKKKGAKRYKAIEDKIKELEVEGEEGRDVRCRVAAFHGGMEYKMFTYFRIRDVRIVYAPPRSIGNYGGDIDNWMWPRHTGDFSILRAYVAPDGSSADYSEDNVPYEPAVHLAMSTKGVNEDDFSMIIGYPGSTQRYRSSISTEWSQNWRFPHRVKMFSDLLAIYSEAAEKDPAVAIKVANFDAMLNNSMKNYHGQLEGFAKARLLERKIEEEKAFTEWIESDKGRKKKYGGVLPTIAKLYKEEEMHREKDAITGIAGFLCQMLGASARIYRWSLEKEKDDMDREPGYMDRDIPRMKMRLGMMDRSYDENVDRAVLKYFLKMTSELPEGQGSPALDGMIGEMPGGSVDERIDALVDKLYSGTKLASAEERNRMFDLSNEELMKEGDTFIEFFARFYPEVKEQEEREKEFGGSITELRPKLIEGMREWKGGAFYPDANGTIRLTFGTVKGYSPRDAVEYDYITSLSGAVEKHTGEDPFDCPGRLVELQARRDYGIFEDRYLGDVPIAFLSTCDITGGNSGSPILNGKGEVIGAAFDGNWESISADYLFNEEFTRAISVESRYILFILEKFSGAKEILGEMTIH